MAEVSPTLDRRTTKTRAVIFGAVRSVGQAHAATALGISESTLCEWLQKHGDRVAQLLTAIALKPVPLEVRCFTPDYVEHLRYFAQMGFAQAKGPTLEWDDGE